MIPSRGGGGDVHVHVKEGAGIVRDMIRPWSARVREGVRRKLNEGETQKMGKINGNLKGKKAQM